jgi:iron complex transport system substrate-binding protein
MQSRTLSASLSALLFSLLLLPAAFAQTVGLSTARSAPSSAATNRNGVSVDYATGFEVVDHGTYRLLTVTRPWPGATRKFRYLLVRRGTPVPPGYAGVPVIRVPIRSIVELSSTYLAETADLGEISTIKGVESLSYVYSPEVRAGIDSGRIKTLGEGQTLNVERLIEMRPDVVMTSAFGGASDVYPKLEEAGLPVVINGDWAELSPLGRAEWIKFIALFYDEGAKAERIFARVASEYHHLAALAAGVKDRPTVFANAPWQGTWGMPGGRSYVAKLFHDAGADYLWSNNRSTGTLFLDFEAVFDRARNADFWINPGTWKNRSDALGVDPRFARFAAFKDDMMFNSIARTTPDGGNDYWESGPADPQRVLEDLIRIFHPGLLPNHKLYFYVRLK